MKAQIGIDYSDEHRTNHDSKDTDAIDYDGTDGINYNGEGDDAVDR